MLAPIFLVLYIRLKKLEDTGMHNLRMSGDDGVLQPEAFLGFNIVLR